jgi:hypothetical protein
VDKYKFLRNLMHFCLKLLHSPRHSLAKHAAYMCIQKPSILCSHKLGLTDTQSKGDDNRIRHFFLFHLRYLHPCSGILDGPCSCGAVVLFKHFESVAVLIGYHQAFVCLSLVLFDL